MTSKLVIFRAFFLFCRPSDPKSEKKIPVNQLIKNLALERFVKYDEYKPLLLYNWQSSHLYDTTP